MKRKKSQALGSLVRESVDESPGRLVTGSTVSTKGQITIPKEIRKRYALNPGVEVEFDLWEEGALLRRRARQRHPAWSVIGSLKSRWRWPKGIPHTVDAYIDYVRGGSYEELTGRKRPAKRQK